MAYTIEFYCRFGCLYDFKMTKKLKKWVGTSFDTLSLKQSNY